MGNNAVLWDVFDGYKVEKVKYYCFKENVGLQLIKLMHKEVGYTSQNIGNKNKNKQMVPNET